MKYSLLIFFLLVGLRLYGMLAPELSVQHSVHLVKGEWVEAEIDLAIAGVEGYGLQRIFFSNPRSLNTFCQGWQFNIPDFGEAEMPRRKFLPPAEHLFKYEYDEDKRLTHVELVKQGISKGGFQISYSSPDLCEVRSSDGSFCKYFFAPAASGGAYLRRVETAKGSCDYTYKTHPTERKLLLTERRTKGSWIKLTYSDLGKIHELYNSSDEGKSFSKICTFEYALGVTSVHDARGAVKHYYYNDTEQIVRIETWMDSALYRTQEIGWQRDQCVKKTTSDALGKLLRRESWKYNERGQVIEEAIEGVIACEGASTQSYAKQYKYNDHGLLIEEQEDNQKQTIHTYNEHQKVIATYLCQNKKIIERHFYTYDLQGRLEVEWHDDGSSMQIDDLSHVSYRKFLRNICYNTLGKPSEQVCGYLDLISQEEVTCAQVILQYDKQGHLLEKRAANEWITHQYDEKGHLQQTATSDGLLTYYFDDQRKVISPTEEQIYSYAANGNLILEEAYKNGKRVSSISYTYDAAGLLISQMDQGGNTTFFHYDALGRKIAEDLPAVPDLNGNLQQPQIQYQYDALDRVIATIDPLGAKQATSYNLYDKALLISFPDGTMEDRRYSLDGYLVKEILRNKTYFVYQNDCIGRIICKSAFDAADHLIEKIDYGYKGMQLVEEKRSSGIDIAHTYDGSGKLIESRLSTGRTINFIYDAQGQLVLQREKINDDEWIETEVALKGDPKVDESETAYFSNARGETVLHTVSRSIDGLQRTIIHDALGRPEQFEIHSSTGQLLHQLNLVYDLANRKIKEILHLIQEGKIVSKIENGWIYNSSGQLQQQLEAMGTPEERSTSYQYNDCGQLTDICKPDGVVLFHSYNTAGELTRFYASDNSFDYQFEYVNGRVSRAHDLVHDAVSLRYYTPEGQVAYEKLANNLEVQNRYDLLGRRIALIIPNEAQIDYRFEKKMLKTITRENKFHEELYRHEYLSFDREGRPLEASLISDLGKVSYSWSSEGKCLSTSSPYFSQESKLDAKSRVIKLTSQDVSGLYESHFQYDALGQLLNENEHFFHHDNSESLLAKDQLSFRVDALLQLFSEQGVLLKYDLNGNLVQKDQIKLSYDALNRLTEVCLDGNTAHSYRYDPWHRRVVDLTPSGKALFLYDGIHEIGSFDETGNLNQFRVFGIMHPTGYQECIAFELDQAVFAPLYDLSGSVVSLVSAATKEIAESYRYSAFGECTVLPAEEIINPWRYANKRCDAITGFLFFGRRDYAPEIGRWTSLDPMGFEDGFNRYAFLHNDPLNQRDLYGLKSISEHWNDFTTWTTDLFKSIGSYLWKLFKGFYTIGAVDHLLELTVGRPFLIFMGHINTKSHQGVYGHGEVNEKVRVSFINGVLADYSDLVNAVQGLSSAHGNVNVNYVYRPTQGWVGDVLFGILVRLGYVSSEAHALADAWKGLIGQMGGVNGGGKIIHYAHSIGALETMHALKLLSPDEQKLVHVHSLGSPTLSSDNPQIHHYISVRDGVGFLDMGAYIQAYSGNSPNVHFVGTHFGLPLIDHLFFNETYQDLWKSMGRTFTDLYGSLPHQAKS